MSRMDAKQKRLLLMLNGAIVIYDGICDELLPLLYKPENRHLLTAFDLIGSALHWMRQETEKA